MRYFLNVNFAFKSEPNYWRPRFLLEAPESSFRFLSLLPPTTIIMDNRSEGEKAAIENGLARTGVRFSWGEM
jgi:hypothetical protein